MGQIDDAGQAEGDGKTAGQKKQEGPHRNAVQGLDCPIHEMFPENAMRNSVTYEIRRTENSGSLKTRDPSFPQGRCQRFFCPPLKDWERGSMRSDPAHVLSGSERNGRISVYRGHGRDIPEVSISRTGKHLYMFLREH